MKINIELNRKSIKEAIKILKSQKKILTDKAIPEYLYRSALWIQRKANEILDNSDIGKDVKLQIKGNWNIIQPNKNHVVLYNMSWKSAFVEFGVGIIGEVFDHPNAFNANWEYNLPTEHKSADGGWFFSVNDESMLDIPQDRIIERITSIDGEIGIYTRGTQGVWYLYNAVEDFKLTEEKRLWEEIKKKYWS